jgi:hypothetical protein
MSLTHRKKLTLFCIIAAGVLVLCAALFVLEDRLWERWYLWKLDTTEDPASRAQIIARLGRVGGESSFRALCENVARECPFFMMSRGFGSDLLVPLDTPSEACWEYSAAVALIRERLGKTKSLALILDIVRRKTADSRARVCCAQWVIIALCEKDALPEALKSAVPPLPGTPEWLTLREGQKDAIEACVSGLESQDAHSRAGASFALSLCGPEASVAIPALRRALEDENRRLKQMVADQALDIQALKAVVAKRW